MSKMLTLQGPMGLRPSAPPRLRGLRRGEMSIAEKARTAVAGIALGLVLVAPVIALVAVVGTTKPVIFAKPSPWVLAAQR